MDWFKIGKGVCQDCILSPCLFNLYAECIMWHAGLDEVQAEIKIAGRNINNPKYPDDTTLMAESEEQLKSLLMKVKGEREKAVLKLNIQLLQLNSRKINDPIKKWDKELNRHFSKEEYRWLTSTWKNAQRHSLSEKCKSKPQWGTISCQSEWLQSKSLQANAGEGVEKREPSYTVGGNAN